MPGILERPEGNYLGEYGSLSILRLLWPRSSGRVRHTFLGLGTREYDGLRRELWLAFWSGWLRALINWAVADRRGRHRLQPSYLLLRQHRFNNSPQKRMRQTICWRRKPRRYPECKS